MVCVYGQEPQQTQEERPVSKFDVKIAWTGRFEIILHVACIVVSQHGIVATVWRESLAGRVFGELTLFKRLTIKKSLANEYISQSVINFNYYFKWF